MLCICQSCHIYVHTWIYSNILHRIHMGVVCVGPSYILSIFYLNILVITYISTVNTYMVNKLLHYIRCTCMYTVTRKKLSEKHLTVCKRQEKKVSRGTVYDIENEVKAVNIASAWLYISNVIYYVYKLLYLFLVHVVFWTWYKYQDICLCRWATWCNYQNSTNTGSSVRFTPFWEFHSIVCSFVCRAKFLRILPNIHLYELNNRNATSKWAVAKFFLDVAQIFKF